MNVRVGSRYIYLPVMIDSCDPPYGVRAGILSPGDVVRVVNLRGCPVANTMGHCHVENPENKEFLGLVCSNSLVKVAKLAAKRLTINRKTKEKTVSEPFRNERRELWARWRQVKGGGWRLEKCEVVLILEDDEVFRLEKRGKSWRKVSLGSLRHQGWGMRKNV